MRAFSQTEHIKDMTVLSQVMARREHDQKRVLTAKCAQHMFDDSTSMEGPPRCGSYSTRETTVTLSDARRGGSKEQSAKLWLWPPVGATCLLVLEQ